MHIMRLSVPLAKALLLSCLCAVPLRGQKPGQVDPFSAYRAEPQCWDSSSARLLKMRSPGIADTVPAFWDLMVFLKASDNRKHSALFWDLAQVFWDIYVECVLARSHGLGRRGLKLPKDRITSVHSLVTDQSFRVNKSQSNFSRLKRSSYAWLSITVRHVGAGVKGHSRTPKITGLSKT
ncbi:protein FAM237A-like [Gadus macrocephalus]|uniref:protein FAM237A-like n=1 Tax=Gadus macrocephalus TaxID=80720 RepID=UPI0028CB305F|nr:protein FAM237A-like [Gadus macrocephalus]